MTSTALYANSNEQIDYAENERLDIQFQQTTPHELAAIGVLMQLCPTLITIDHQYHHGMSKIAGELLPNAKNPIAEIKLLTTAKEYTSIMQEARQDANKAGEQANREICEDIQSYGADFDHAP
ncbi:MAG: hypothetical protein Q4D05_05325 [Acinetobacter sp.]|nr:hypothetical protein [Acinetobacter sp.]